MIPLTPKGLIARRIEAVFGHLSRNEFEPLLDGMTADVRHSFPGSHPLGGTRVGREKIAAWFERLDHLFPVHEFEVLEVLSGGPPWRISVTVRWRGTVEPRVGPAYENEGIHFMRIDWGKVSRLHAYLDSQAVAEACERMAHEGVPDAAAAPIV